MRPILSRTLLAAALASAGPAAGAEAPQPRPTPAPQPRPGPTPTPEIRPVLGAGTPDARPVKVHASHRVDVIAPGEKVETILDRMRLQRLAPPPEDSRAPLPVHGMDRRDPQNPGPGAGPNRFPPAFQPPSGGSFPTRPRERGHR